MILILWIIAICEVIRMLQNAVQVNMLIRDTKSRDNAYEEFVKSLKATDREFVKRMLEEFEEVENDKPRNVTGMSERR